MNWYLFFGYAVFWTLIFCYVVYLHRRQKELARSLRELSDQIRD